MDAETHDPRARWRTLPPESTPDETVAETGTDQAPSELFSDFDSPLARATIAGG